MLQRVHIRLGTTRPNDRKEWVNDLYGSLPIYDLAIITVTGMVSKQGCYDDLMVGGAAAILTAGLGDEKVQRARRWCLGTGVIQHDVDLFELANAAKWIDLYYTERTPPRHVYILCRNSSALWYSRLSYGVTSIQRRRQGAVHLFRVCQRKDTCSCHSCGGFGLLSQLYRSFLDLVARRQGHSGARPEQDTFNGIRPIRPRAAQLRWLQGRMHLRCKLAFEGKAEGVWWDGVC